MGLAWRLERPVSWTQRLTDKATTCVTGRPAGPRQWANLRRRCHCLGVALDILHTHCLRRPIVEQTGAQSADRPDRAHNGDPRLCLFETRDVYDRASELTERWATRLRY